MVMCSKGLAPQYNEGNLSIRYPFMTTTAENPTLPTDSMLYARDVVPYLGRFIESGGTYKEAVDGREGPPTLGGSPALHGASSAGRGPIYGVMVSYNNRSVLLASGHMGSSGIALMVPNNLDTGFRWEIIVVNSKDLDTAVCYWLDVPRP
jgi:hypothetical protein